MGNPVDPRPRSSSRGALRPSCCQGGHRPPCQGIEQEDFGQFWRSSDYIAQSTPQSVSRGFWRLREERVLETQRRGTLFPLPSRRVRSLVLPHSARIWCSTTKSFQIRSSSPMARSHTWRQPHRLLCKEKRTKGSSLGRASGLDSKFDTELSWLAILCILNESGSSVPGMLLVPLLMFFYHTVSTCSRNSTLMKQRRASALGSQTADQRDGAAVRIL